MTITRRNPAREDNAPERRPFAFGALLSGMDYTMSVDHRQDGYWIEADGYVTHTEGSGHGHLCGILRMSFRETLDRIRSAG